MGRRPNYEYDATNYRSRARELHEANPKWTEAEIASYLRISEPTVNRYLKKIKRQEHA